MISFCRYEIGQTDRTRRTVESGLQHQGITAIAAGDRRLLVEAIRQLPFCDVPNSAAQHASLSKRGRQSQSIDPQRATKVISSERRTLTWRAGASMMYRMA